MSELDPQLLAERAMAVERHLGRVGNRLPGHASDFRPSTDAADAVILHLWKAVQIVIDLAVTACLQFDLGAPQSYADAFRRLEAAGIVDPPLANRLVLATGFRNVVAHAYEAIDVHRVHRAASDEPADLRALLGALEHRLRQD